MPKDIKKTNIFVDWFNSVRRNFMYYDVIVRTDSIFIRLDQPSQLIVV